MVKMELALEAIDIHKQYRLKQHIVPVLNGIDLQVETGEWVALVGPSGSGKTTLLHLLGALDSPDQGTVKCHGEDYRQLSGKRRSAIRTHNLGLVFQAYHLFPELTSLENVMLPALRWGLNNSSLRGRAQLLLESFGLGDRLAHRPLELSGGEQQRVSLARALINDPDIILADEPTGNLDPESGRQIIDILADLHQSQSKTIVMVTHDRQLADQADRIFRLQDGLAITNGAAPPA
jgi:ABC-type lipoprotein export system ATPase subunit